MAALQAERGYGLSCGRLGRGTRVSVFHVKLTESALRAFESYQACKVRAAGCGAVGTATAAGGRSPRGPWTEPRGRHRRGWHRRRFGGGKVSSQSGVGGGHGTGPAAAVGCVAGGGGADPGGWLGKRGGARCEAFPGERLRRCRGLPAPPSV